MQFVFIEDKKPHELKPGDHFIHDGRFWRIDENFNVLGYPEHMRRMLKIAPHQMTSPRGHKFLEITSESRIEAYEKTE